MSDRMQENILCVIAGIVFAIAFIATICGDGNRGLIDLF